MVEREVLPSRYTQGWSIALLGVQIFLTLVKNHQKFSMFQDTKGVMIKRQYLRLVLDAETSLGGGGSLVFL